MHLRATLEQLAERAGDVAAVFVGGAPRESGIRADTRRTTSKQLADERPRPLRAAPDPD
jgi:hypothetical protein